MNRLDLIIDALESAHHTNDTGVMGLTKSRLDVALAAARELKALAQPEHNHLSDAMSVLTDVNADLIKEAKLAQPEQEPFKPDWVSYRQGVADGAAQPEQLLPPVDIGVDVTPEGTHVVAFYNRHDAVQEMFYSRFHPLEKPEQEPVEHAVIAGVLFDFMGWLTSRPKRLVLSASDEASPAVKVIEEFAQMRGLSLDDAKVKDWQDMTAQPEQAAVPFPSFMRRRIEQAMEDAINPRGMSVHDGKAKVLASDLHRMLSVIDSATQRKPWVGLTDKERNEMIGRIQHDQYTRQRDLIGKTQIITEMYLKEKNNAV